MTTKPPRFASAGIFIAILAGGVFGYLAPQLMKAIDFAGVIFVYAPIFAVFPILVCSVTLRLSRLGTSIKLNRVIGKTALYFLIFGLLCSALGIIAGELFKPGIGINLLTSDIHTDWAPTMPFEMPWPLFAGFALFTLFAGYALISTGTRSRNLSSLLEQMEQVSLRIVNGLLFVAPIGLFVLVGSMIAKDQAARVAISSMLGNGNEWQTAYLASAGSYLFTVSAVLLFTGVLVLPLTYWLFTKNSPLKFLTKMSSAIMTAFGTNSTVASMPFAYSEIATDDSTDNRAGALVLPLATIFNSGITSMVTAVATVFIAQTAGISLGLLEYLIIMTFPLVLAIGRTGMPYPLPAILLLLFPLLGFDPAVAASLGMILIVDWLVDRLRASVGMVSDVVAVAVIGESFEFKTASNMRVSSKAPGPRYGKEGSSRSTASNRGREDTRHRRGGSERREHTPRERSVPLAEGRRTGARERTRPQDKREQAKTDQTVSRRTTPRRDISTESPFDMSANRQSNFEIDLSPSKNEKRESGRGSLDREVSRERSTERTSRDFSRQGTPKPPRTRRESPARSERTSQPTSSTQENGPKQSEPPVKKQSRTKVSASKLADSSPVQSNEPLSPEKIARELERVSAKLETQPLDAKKNIRDVSPTSSSPTLFDQEEKSSDISIPSSFEDDSTDSTSKLSVTVESANVSRESETVTDQDEEKVGKEMSSSEKTDEVTQEVETVEPEVAEMRYGRGRTRRHQPKADKTEPASDETAATQNEAVSPPAAEEKPSEQVTSYGRVKKKRVRR